MKTKWSSSVQKWSEIKFVVRCGAVSTGGRTSVDRHWVLWVKHKIITNGHYVFVDCAPFVDGIQTCFCMRTNAKHAECPCTGQCMPRLIFKHISIKEQNYEISDWPGTPFTCPLWNVHFLTLAKVKSVNKSGLARETGPIIYSMWHPFHTKHCYAPHIHFVLNGMHPQATPNPTSSLSEVLICCQHIYSPKKNTTGLVCCGCPFFHFVAIQRHFYTTCASHLAYISTIVEMYLHIRLHTCFALVVRHNLCHDCLLQSTSHNHQRGQCNQYSCFFLPETNEARTHYCHNDFVCALESFVPSWTFVDKMFLWHFYEHQNEHASK